MRCENSRGSSKASRLTVSPRRAAQRRVRDSPQPQTGRSAQHRELIRDASIKLAYRDDGKSQLELKNLWVLT